MIMSVCTYSLSNDICGVTCKLHVLKDWSVVCSTKAFGILCLKLQRAMVNLTGMDAVQSVISAHQRGFRPSGHDGDARCHNGALQVAAANCQLSPSVDKRKGAKKRRYEKTEIR